MLQRHPWLRAPLPLLLLGLFVVCDIRAGTSQDYPEPFSSNGGAFSVYCTNNLDGTGLCRRADSKERLGCLMLPANQVICRSSDDQIVICVAFGAAEWSCTPMPANQISPDIVNNPALRIPSREERRDPLRNRLTPTLYDTLDPNSP